MVNSNTAFGSRGQHVFQADVGKRSSSHHPVVTSAASVAVEVFDADVVFLKVFASWAAAFDGSGRADVVGCCGITDRN